MWRSVELLGWLLLVPLFARGGSITFDFEGFSDGTALTNQYAGILFANTSVLTAGISLNDLEFPPHSGTNVAADAGGPISIAFSSPILNFSGYFTYASAVTITAFDSLNQIVGTTNSAFTANYVSSGNPPNDLLQISYAGGISDLTIAGNLAGSSFVMDDVTITTPGIAAPEPASGLMVLSVILAAVLWSRRSRFSAKR